MTPSVVRDAFSGSVTHSVVRGVVGSVVRVTLGGSRSSRSSVRDTFSGSCSSWFRDIFSGP